MVVVAAAKPHVAAIVRRHNAILRAAHDRIDGSLEEKLAALIQPILEKAGNQAAARFQKLATNHLTAALHERADQQALQRIAPGLADDGFFGYRLRPFALTASAPTPSSAMICVKPRPDEAAEIAWPDGETAESLHVTLVYLGPVDGSLQEIADALAPVAASHAPLEGVVGGVGKFQPPGVAILLPDVPGLVELRVAVTEALVERGIFYARDHGFEAHVSIDAAPDPDTLEKALARTAQKPLHFDAILIVRGDSEVVEVPLIGPRPVTASGLVAAGEHVGWTGPAGDELIDVDKLVASLRTKTDPVRMAVLKSSMDPALEAAGISFDVSNPLTAKVLSQAGSQVKGIAETTQLNVMRIIDRSYNQGLSIPDTAKAIKAGMAQASSSRARTIARTELAGAANGGSLAATMLAAGALGIGFYKQWLCVAPWTRVAAAGVLAAVRKPYEGELVTITARPAGRFGGPAPAVRSFSVTPDHLVLTQRGWLPAGLVDESDQVVGGVFAESDTAGQPDVNDIQPTIEEIFDATADRLAAVGMMSAPVYLDDGRTGEKVDVVTADSGLSYDLDATLGEPLRELMLSFSDVGLDELLRGSPLPDGFVGHRSSAPGGIPEPRLRQKAVAVASSPQNISLALRPDPCAMLNEDVMDGTLGAAETSSEILLRFAGLVRFDDVVGVERREWTGHVYDLTTLSGWFFADGYVAHNTAPGAPHPRHEDYEGLDGQTVGLEDAFDVGGNAFQFPGDPDGAPEDSINCRCSLAYTETPPEDAAVTAEPEGGLTEEGVSQSGTTALDEAMPLTAPAGDTVSVNSTPFVPSPVVDRIKALGLDKPLKDVRPTTDIGREVYARGPTTEDLFKQGGEWTPERQQIHADIVAKHFEGKTPPVAGSPKSAIFTSGGGASGKGSTMIDIGDRHFPLSELEDHPERFPDVVLTNPDIIKAMLPEYEQLRNAGDLYAASGVHEESSAIGKVVAEIAQRQGYNVVIDTTGSSSSFVGKLEQAVKDGYEVKVRMVSVPTNEAVVRAMARGDRSGRYVAIDPLKGAHRGASAQLAIWKDMPNLDWQLFDNTDTRVLVAEKKAGEPVVIHDQAKWDQILAKANETSAAPGSALGVETKPVEAPAVPADVRTVADIVPGPDAETLAHVQSFQQTRFDDFAAGYPVGQFGTSVNEIRDGYRTAVDQKIADLTATADVQIRVTPHILDKIVEDGRFKSQFEVEHSGGAFNRPLRSQAEQTMFGYSHDLPVEERPIYGYLSGSTAEDGSVSQYGPIIVRLTDAASKRSTFTLTDSLGEGGRRQLVPVALADGQVAGKADAFSVFTTKDPLKESSLKGISDVYAEAQVHGGVTLADIAEVIIPKEEMAYRLEGLNRDIGLLEGRIAREQEFIDTHGEAAAQASGRTSIARLNERLADYQAQAALLVDDAAALRAKLATAGIKATLS